MQYCTVQFPIDVQYMFLRNRSTHTVRICIVCVSTVRIPIYKLTEFVQIETIKGNKQPKAPVSTYKQPQHEFIQKWYSQMLAFAPHYYHVEWHKKQLDFFSPKCSL